MPLQACIPLQLARAAPDQIDVFAASTQLQELRGTHILS